MTHEQTSTQTKAVALALHQIRILLSGYLGSHVEADIQVRQAAHLAYALHNEALALVEGGGFDSEAVNHRLAAVARMLGSEFAQHFGRVLGPLGSNGGEPLP